LGHAYGPVALESPVYDFTETSYYNASMGDDLKKQFVAFETLVAPDAIVDAKRATNQLEQDYIAQHSAPEERSSFVHVEGDLRRGHVVLSQERMVQQ